MTTHPDIGATIEHKQARGYRMTIRDVKPCENQSTVFPHNRYLITDPDGCDDWLCEYDTVRVHA